MRYEAAHLFLSSRETVWNGNRRTLVSPGRMDGLPLMSSWRPALRTLRLPIVSNLRPRASAAPLFRDCLAGIKTPSRRGGDPAADRKPWLCRPCDARRAIRGSLPS